MNHSNTSLTKKTVQLSTVKKGTTSFWVSHSTICKDEIEGWTHQTAIIFRWTHLTVVFKCPSVALSADGSWWDKNLKKNYGGLATLSKKQTKPLTRMSKVLDNVDEEPILIWTSRSQCPTQRLFPGWNSTFTLGLAWFFFFGSSGSSIQISCWFLLAKFRCQKSTKITISPRFYSKPGSQQKPLGDWQNFTVYSESPKLHLVDPWRKGRHRFLYRKTGLLRPSWHRCFGVLGKL